MIVQIKSEASLNGWIVNQIQKAKSDSTKSVT